MATASFYFLLFALVVSIVVFLYRWRQDFDQPKYKATIDPEILARLHAEWDATARERHFRTVTQKREVR